MTRARDKRQGGTGGNGLKRQERAMFIIQRRGVFICLWCKGWWRGRQDNNEAGVAFEVDIRGISMAFKEQGGRKAGGDLQSCHTHNAFPISNVSTLSILDSLWLRTACTAVLCNLILGEKHEGNRE